MSDAPSQTGDAVRAASHIEKRLCNNVLQGARNAGKEKEISSAPAQSQVVTGQTLDLAPDACNGTKDEGSLVTAIHKPKHRVYRIHTSDAEKDGVATVGAAHNLHQDKSHSREYSYCTSAKLLNTQQDLVQGEGAKSSPCTCSSPRDKPHHGAASGVVVTRSFEDEKAAPAAGGAQRSNAGRATEGKAEPAALPRQGNAHVPGSVVIKRGGRHTEELSRSRSRSRSRKRRQHRSRSRSRDGRKWRGDGRRSGSHSRSRSRVGRNNRGRSGSPTARRSRHGRSGRSRSRSRSFSKSRDDIRSRRHRRRHSSDSPPRVESREGTKERERGRSHGRGQELGPAGSPSRLRQREEQRGRHVHPLHRSRNRSRSGSRHSARSRGSRSPGHGRHSRRHRSRSQRRHRQDVPGTHAQRVPGDGQLVQGGAAAAPPHAAGPGSPPVSPHSPKRAQQAQHASPASRHAADGAQHTPAVPPLSPLPSNHAAPLEASQQLPPSPGAGTPPQPSRARPAAAPAAPAAAATEQAGEGGGRKAFGAHSGSSPPEGKGSLVVRLRIRPSGQREGEGQAGVEPPTSPPSQPEATLDQPGRPPLQGRTEQPGGPSKRPRAAEDHPAAQSRQAERGKQEHHDTHAQPVGKVGGAALRQRLSFGDELDEGEEVEEEGGGQQGSKRGKGMAVATARRFMRERELTVLHPLLGPGHAVPAVHEDDLALPAGGDLGTGSSLGAMHFGVALAKGRRPYMEDRHTIVSSLLPLSSTHVPLQDGVPRSFAAVYDGHNGAMAAEHAAERLHHLLAGEPALRTCTGDGPPSTLSLEAERMEAALRHAFETTDREILMRCQLGGDKSGSTGVAVVRIGDVLYAAHAGDSRAVLCRRAGAPLRLTEDHKPNLPHERARVEGAGGRVDFARCWRVIVDPGGGRPASGLAVSRSFGDPDFKEPRHLVTATPEVTQHKLKPGDDFIVVASDGLWDVLTDEEACQEVLKHLRPPAHSPTAGPPGGPGGGGGATSHRDSRLATAAAEALVQLSLMKGTMDNVTAIVALLSWT